ncbi:unnamed protein product [Phaedon cochleariae]|uniref:UDP-glucuronosyltransferase n=1 Tax=Phaedon cochleariae TaxID=80249 RepID=A0A9P0DVR4_PHACE|nr:unnamed protein product [Phaedon cochleariae]
MHHHMVFVKLIGFIVLFLNASVSSVSCANILITEDLASPSHQIWNYAIADALVARGHNVTVIGPKTISRENRKFHFILLEGLTEATTGSGFYLPDTLSHLSALRNIQLYNAVSLLSCNYTLHTKGLQTLINYPEDFKFDLIILDLTISPCLLPLIERFKTPPAVVISALILPPSLSETFGNSFPVSYVPYIMLRNSARMDFSERLHNFIFSRIDLYWRAYYSFPIMEQMSKSVFGENTQSLDALVKKATFLLCNLSPGFHYSQPLTPNIIPVGGLHIDTKKKLPRDLQDIMDSAKNGVILFSLGTNVKSVDMSLEKINNILKAFSKVNQTVLWKFESDLTNLPKNVIIRKWIPQTEILAHPNLKLFITHGGGLSTIEAAFYGIPMVGIPFFADQYSNMELVETREIGVTMQYDTLTSESLLEAINNVLTNPKYLKNAKRISSLMRDQPQTSMERALFWIEFAMRNNGTNIYDPQSRHISDFISSSFDIYLFLLLIFCLFAYFIVLKIVLVLWRLVNWKQKKVKMN